MTTLEQEIKRYEPALTLETFFPTRERSIVIMILSLLSATLGIVVALFFIVEQYSFSVLFNEAELYFALFLIFCSALFAIAALSLFSNQLYFRGIETIIHEGKTKRPRITYEVAQTLWRGLDDITKAFVTSAHGRSILMRLHVPFEDVRTFLNSKEERITSSSIEFIKDGFLTLDALAEHIFKFDLEFQKFLFSKGVTEEAFFGATSWVVRTYQERKHDKRWWSRDNLGKLNSIGKDWSYGGAYMLEDYKRDIKTTGVFSVLSRDVAYADEKVKQIETTLARAQDANVILVGEQGVGKMDVVARFSRKLNQGEIVGPLVDDQVVVFDTNAFIASHDNKELFEGAFLKLLAQAEEAGGIIIVIDNLPTFIESTHGIGVAAGALMDKYLASPNIHFIATADPVRYHNEMEVKPQLAAHFERVQIENPDLSNAQRVIEKLALAYEKKYNVTFTYFAIRALVETADQYLTDGVMPDKAIDLMSEVASIAGAKKESIIAKEFVHEYVSQKTGIPTGPMTKMERKKLLSLEDLLHERVIGQKQAVKAISNAMRRARTGIQSTKRPMGTFLFLGPTGVGKTETAKALAALFFNNEDRMLRFDMSEYSGSDALQRLIGEGTQSGALANTLREHPYGVLLLDEFEKAARGVHDLFLQIIDEGVFSDARGSRINARNTIIIATSNAGSQLILDFIKKKVDPSDKKDEIIENIINNGVYRPELINRFDGVIIFEPLDHNDLEKVARLMLEGLKKRIKRKGYELVIDDVLINLLTTEGYSPQFGARPMRRVMQDRIEEKIAEKIIRGSLKPGDELWFYEEDFND